MPGSSNCLVMGRRVRLARVWALDYLSKIFHHKSDNSPASISCLCTDFVFSDLDTKYCTYCTRSILYKLMARNMRRNKNCAGQVSWLVRLSLPWPQVADEAVLAVISEPFNAVEREPLRGRRAKASHRLRPAHQRFDNLSTTIIIFELINGDFSDFV